MNDCNARSIKRAHRMFVNMSDVDKKTATYVIRRPAGNIQAEFLLSVVLINRVKYSHAMSTSSFLTEFPFQHDATSATLLYIGLVSFISPIHEKPDVIIYTSLFVLCILIRFEVNTFLLSLLDLSFASNFTFLILPELFSRCWAVFLIVFTTLRITLSFARVSQQGRSDSRAVRFDLFQ